jgi:FkbM family methyltransferase
MDMNKSEDQSTITARTLFRNVVNRVLSPFSLRIGRLRSPSAGYKVSLRDAFEGVRVPLVIDVGANTGQAAMEILVARPEAEIYSFEPFPDAYRRLQQNLPSHCHAYNVGLGDSDGERELHAFPNSQTNSFLPGANGIDKVAPYLINQIGCVRVPVRRLDGFLDEIGVVRAIDYLKIDVQGFEDRVLDGAREVLKRTRHAMIEVTFNSVYLGGCLVDEICHRMHESGFKLIRSIGYLPGEHVDDLVSADFFFRNMVLVGATANRQV